MVVEPLKNKRVNYGDIGLKKEAIVIKNLNYAFLAEEVKSAVEWLKKECERDIHPNMDADGSEGIPCWHCNKIDLAFVDVVKKEDK